METSAELRGVEGGLERIRGRVGRKFEIKVMESKNLLSKSCIGLENFLVMYWHTYEIV